MNKELENLVKIKSRLLLDGNCLETAKISYDISCIYLGKEHFADAVSELTTAVEFCTQVEDSLETPTKILLADILRSLGDAYLETGDHKSAVAAHLKFLKVTQEMQNDVMIQRAWATLGRTYYEITSRFDLDLDELPKLELTEKAEEAYLTASIYLKRLKGTIPIKEEIEMRTRLLINLGLVYEKQGAYSKCANCMRKALCLCKEHKLTEDLHRCQFSLAAMYQSLGQHALALQLIEEAIGTAKVMASQKLLSECYLTKTLVHLATEEVDEARASIRLSYKNTTETRRCELRKLYQVVITIKECRDGLDKQSVERGMRNLERLGDAWAYLRHFKKAIVQYQKLLELGLESSLESNKLAPIYFSIAQSYEDDHQPEEALEYYAKEMECNQGNHKEQVETLLKMAAIRESLLDRKEAEETFNEAVELALGDKLKGRCLLRLKEFQLNNELGEKAKETERRLQEIGFEEISSSEEEESEDPYEDIQVTSEEEEETKVRSTVKRSRGIDWTKKKNEKGESPLHVACIAGNIKQVSKLIEQGHPLNLRDNSGWIPLHEACNFGHTEIVSILLREGAWVNDPGGQFCDGVTPLHDAASGGHFEVIRLLLQHKADEGKVTRDGQRPLDSLLEWRTRVSELSEQDEEEFQEVARLLGSEGPISEQPNCESRQSLYPSANEDSPVEVSSEDESPPITTERNLDDPDVARKEYQNVMQSVRRSAPKVQRSNKKVIPALLSGDHVVDDWLIEDQPSAPKRLKTMRQTKLDIPIFKRRKPTKNRVHSPCPPLKEGDDLMEISTNQTEPSAEDAQVANLTNGSKIPSLSTEYSQEIIKILDRSKETGILELEHMRMTPVTLSQVLNGAQSFGHLQQLTMSGLRLSVEPNLGLLCQLIRSNPLLLHLRLEGCGLDHHFLEVMRPTPNAKLKSLSLNYNSFGETRQEVLLQFLSSFPHLEILHLQYSDLDPGFRPHLLLHSTQLYL